MTQDHPIMQLSKRYPQLKFPVREGMRSDKVFRAVVLGGEETDLVPVFNTTKKDTFDSVDTPAGKVEILYLADREDFVHAYQCLCYYCEPVEIPDSTGAVTIGGINNWEKIRALKVPVSRADKWDYKDVIILLSCGSYSNIDIPEGFSGEAWLEKSYIIRKYHELTHFISRKLFPENKEAIRDEIMADMVGLLFAFKSYNPDLAKRFLGMEKAPEYREGGRLQNYLQEGESLEDAMKRAERIIRIFSENLLVVTPKDGIKSPFDIVLDYEERKLGI